MIVAKFFLMNNSYFQASSVHAWHTVSTFQGRRGVLIPNTKVFLPTIVLSRDLIIRVMLLLIQGRGGREEK